MFGKGHGKVIAKASKKASRTLSMFKKADAALDKANLQLQAVIDKAQQEAQDKLVKAQQEATELLAHAEQAEKDMNANFKVQKHLKNFVN
jgi:hypothetical protein